MFILFFLFFISGFTALLYQVSWQRLLMLFVGSDTYSVAIVVTVFLFGLGVGSLLGGRFADRLTTGRALIVYAILECATGLYAILTPWLFESFLRHNSVLAGMGSYGLMAGCFLFLLLPTILMGMALPCLSKAVIRKNDSAAKKSAELYGVNILGAAVGSLVTGWYIVGTYGYHVAIYFGAIMNVLIAIMAAAFYKASHFSYYHNRQPEKLHHFDRDVMSVGDQVATRWYLIFFISGFVAISLEVIWFRILSVVYGGSGAYLFSTLLFFFLLFDGIGTYYAIKKIHKIKNGYSLVLLLQGIICCYAIVSVYVLTTSYFQISILTMLLLPFFLIAPPAFIAGMSFPVIQAAIQGDERYTSRKIGYMQAANIFGNVLAGVLTSLIFLEFIGSSGAIRIIAFIGVIATFSSILWNSKKLLLQIFFLFVLVVFIVIMPPETNFWKGIIRVEDKDRAVYFNESASGTSALIEYGNHEGVTVYINGNHQGGIPYGAGHIYMGLLPGLVHADASNILIIGLGSGATAYSIGITEKAERIDVIEIIRGHKSFLEEYIRRAGYISKSMFDDQRYFFIEGDGRKFLNDTNMKYDIIQADIVHPDKSGSGFVYSREFFNEAATKLKPGGIMAQWCPTDRVKQTFMTVFPYGVALNGFVLIGSNQPIQIDKSALLGKVSINRVANHLHITDEQAALMLNDFISDQAIVYWGPLDSRDADINTDAHPKDEYRLNTDSEVLSGYIDAIKLYLNN